MVGLSKIPWGLRAKSEWSMRDGATTRMRVRCNTGSATKRARYELSLERAARSGRSRNDTGIGTVDIGIRMTFVIDLRIYKIIS